jgi:hypothetical protein
VAQEVECLSSSEFKFQKCGKLHGKQSHRDHFAGSRNFIMLADSGEINSQNPKPQSVSGDELYTPQMVYVTRGFLQYMFHRWSERQVSYRETSWYSFPSRPLQTVVTVTGNLAEPRWRSVTLISLQLVSPRVGNSRQVLDTQ